MHALIACVGDLLCLLDYSQLAEYPSIIFSIWYYLD